MRIKKKFAFLILTIFLTALLTSAKTSLAQSMPPNQLILPKQSFTIPFSWQGDSLPSGFEPHAALLIPVHIKNCPYQFYMQFDLGSPYSLLYKNKLEAIRMKYPASLPAETEQQLNNFSFLVHETSILAKSIRVQQFDSAGIDWEQTKEPQIIGTVGSDLIDGSVALIDYPNQQLTISPNLPESMKVTTGFSPFVFANRSVLLPAFLNGEKTYLYFDTGSSMFELLTDSSTSHQMAATGAKPRQYSVNSWGKMVTAHTLPTNDSIQIGNTAIPIRTTTYMGGISQSQIDQMSKMGIGGMTGNKLFLNYVLILDTKNQVFTLTAAERERLVR